MLSMETAAMSEANKVFQEFYTNPKDRYAYEAAERLEAEKASLYSEGHSKGKQEGIQQGREEGIQEGIQQRDFEIIRNMRLKGLSDEDILNLTGISKDVLIKL